MIRLRFVVTLLCAAAHASSAMALCVGTWTQKMPTSSPPARSEGSMVFDSQRGVAVLFGGADNSSTLLNDTWVWDGANWTQKTPLAAPAPRALFAMAYDSKRNVTVLFGGFNGTNALGETWEWNGTNWANRVSPTQPSTRAASAMAFDAARGVMVMFGGVAISGSTATFLADTWEWDGTNWTEVFPADSPSSRAVHSMSYDSRRQRIVLFGGTPDNNLALGDTWEWDGTAWSQKIPPNPAIIPSPRIFHCAAFDPLANVTVLFGGRGITAGTANQETWEWDGTSWFHRNSLANPSARQGSAMAFDIAREAILLFGGNDGAAQSDTWQWIGPTPRITQQPADQSVVAGTSATFSIAATAENGNPNPNPMTFQWRKGGVNLANGGHISGATTSTLTINPAETADDGQYDCITEQCATTTSRAATLDTCKPASAADDCNTNGIADACDIAANPSLDANNNGVIDSCEPAPTTTTDAGSQGLPNAQTAPCGTCGAGAAGMIPLALLSLGAVRRQRSRSRFQKVIS